MTASTSAVTSSAARAYGPIRALQCGQRPVTGSTEHPQPAPGQHLAEAFRARPRGALAVIITGADGITRSHLEALADACERRVPLTLLFRHLRDDATALIGGAAATAFMRLANHHEAEQAAAFIGRHHKFTVSGWTATRGGEHSAARTSGYSLAVIAEVPPALAEGLGRQQAANALGIHVGIGPRRVRRSG
jgi:hypothetical protein